MKNGYTLCKDGLWRKEVEFPVSGGHTIIVRDRYWKLLKTERPNKRNQLWKLRSG